MTNMISVINQEWLTYPTATYIILAVWQQTGVTKVISISYKIIAYWLEMFSYFCFIRENFNLLLTPSPDSSAQGILLPPLPPVFDLVCQLWPRW